MIDIIDPTKIDKNIRLYKKSIEKLENKKTVVMAVLFLLAIFSVAASIISLVFDPKNISRIFFLIPFGFMLLSFPAILLSEKAFDILIRKVKVIKAEVYYFMAFYESKEILSPALYSQYQDGYVNDSLLEKL